ncbi:MAG: DUF202 domain-containing protein [Anaerolineae bacterium]|jgi:putative membrane protein
MALEATEAQQAAQRPEEPETILRDRLAAIRTDLANERTLLAYGRTGFALVAAGVTFINLFAPAWAVLVGWAMIPIGVAVLVVGVLRFRRLNKRIEHLIPRDY